MKPRTVIFIALAVFAVSAWLAWSTAAPPDGESHLIANQRSQVPPKSQELPAYQKLIATLERELIAGPVEQIPSYSGKEMDSILSREGWEAAFFYGCNWADNDPAAMCEWIERRGFIPGVFRMDRSGDFVSTLFEKWAARDADAALAAALRLSRAPGRAQALASAVQVIWRSDPKRARRVLAEHGEFLARSPDIRLSYEGVKNGPDDLKFLASLPAGELRGKLLSMVLANAVDSYSKSAHAETTAFWAGLPQDVKQELVAGGFCQRMNALVNFGHSAEANSLPPFAEEADLLRGHAEASGNATAARDYIMGHGDVWAASDPAVAVAWSLAHLKGSDRLHYTAGLFRAAADSDFDRAIAAWQTLPPGILKARAAGALIAGTPDDRKPEALALLDILSAHDRGVAEKEANTRR